MTAAATTTQEASLAALAVMGYRNVGAMRIKRPCEANFFAYFLSSLKESMIIRIKLKGKAEGFEVLTLNSLNDIE